MTGNEGVDFQPGSRPVLDEYDGFFDQALDTIQPGAELFFLLSDPKQLHSTGSKRSCPEMRPYLDHAPMITGRLLENAAGHFVFEVHKRETFSEVVRRKPLSVHNEAVSEVARHKKIWECAAESRRKMGSHYRFKLVCGLPSLSSVELALHTGFHCSPQMDFSSEPPAEAPNGTLFLEPLAGTSVVRVIALGDNDINSSRVFDLTDVNEYREAIRGMLNRASFKEEANCWNSLLE